MRMHHTTNSSQEQTIIMNLQDFLLFTYEGAFTVFQNIITSACLRNRDRKALRLALGSPLAEAILPYLVERLFLSQHEENLEVFALVAARPALSRMVTQVCWDSTLPSSVFKRSRVGDASEERMTLFSGLIRYSDCSTVSQDQGVLDQESQQQWRLYLEAREFWTKKIASWRKVEETGRDLALFEKSLLHLRNLRRITILDEQRFPCVPYAQYQESWTSPQVQSWAKLPFNHFLPIPRKTHIDVNGCWRIMDQFVRCHATGSLEIGALIIDTYGRGQLTRSINRRGEDTRFDVRTQPYKNFDSITNGYGSLVPDLPRSKKLTLRLIKEVGGRHQSLWEGDRGVSSILNNHAALWEHSLEELTVCRVNLAEMTAHFSALQVNRKDLFNIMTQCKNLRRIRLYGCWCPDPASVLTWIWQHTTIREVELHFVISGATWWSVVMNELRAGGVAFDFMELTECIVCEDPLEAASELEDGELWFGKSEHVVPWLRHETTEYPLQNVPPGDEGLMLDLQSFVASLDRGVA